MAATQSGVLFIVDEISAGKGGGGRMYVYTDTATHGLVADRTNMFFATNPLLVGG